MSKRMVYSQAFEDTNIWRFELERRAALRKVVSSTQYDSSPSLSPDGTRLVFRSNRSGSNEIWESDAEGRAAFQLTRGCKMSVARRWQSPSLPCVYRMGDLWPCSRPDLELATRLY
jgi:Tol biopolymer transport system component